LAGFVGGGVGNLLEQGGSQDAPMAMAWGKDGGGAARETPWIASDHHMQPGMLSACSRHRELHLAAFLRGTWLDEVGDASPKG
jgi:hypothetical protein